MMFTLQGLFEEYQRHRNKWSTSNVDLELVRYHGCSMKLYRSPTADFIFQYNRKAPFNDTQLTCPAMQPCVQLNTKGKKIILKSFATKPKGRGSVTVKIAPPTLFQDRWYFQKDLRNVPLVTTKAIAANLRFPFCPPQTDNVCITFQVLAAEYNNFLSITEPAVSDSKAEEFINNFLSKAIPDTPERHANILNTLRTANTTKN